MQTDTHFILIHFIYLFFPGRDAGGGVRVRAGAEGGVRGR